MNSLAGEIPIQETPDFSESGRDLNCLNNVFWLAEKPEITIEELFRKIVELIPSSFRHPEMVAVRITFNEQEFTSKNFKETCWKQDGKIIVSGTLKGLLEVYCLESKNKTPEGRCLPLEEKKELIVAISDRLGAVVERKQKETDLKRNLRKTEREKMVAEAIIAAIGDGISIQDTKFKILFQNQSHKDMMGEHEDEYCYKAYEQNDNTCDGCPLAKSFEDGKSHRVELVKYTDKGVHYFEITTSPLRNSAGKIVSGIELVREITERKKAEQEAVKTINLESLGTLAGGLAHDYNNLLTSVFGNIELAKMHITQDEVTEATHRFLDAASRASGKAQYLTRQLLTFSMGGAPIKQVQSVIDIIKEAEPLAFKGSQVECSLDFPKDLWQVMIDGKQMGQVFHNLFLNAKDAMPSGGEVWVAAENINIGSSSSVPLEKGRYVKILIADTGTGIESINISRIFDPYFTTKSFGTRRGAGLGLAICHSVIKKHGGYIKAKSESGKGSTFQVYLPVCEGQ